MNINKERISIIGSGTMGHSLAVSAAMAGLDVDVWGFDEQDIARAKNGIAEKLEIMEPYEIIENDKKGIKKLINFSLSLKDVAENATFIIEAIPEKLELKQKMFSDLEKICSRETVLASNTSGLSPTDIAENISYPERTVVTHFWSPGHLIPLVEVVRGEHTSEETVQRTKELLEIMNKKPVVLNKDIMGSIVNRLQYALFREAQYILEQGVATVEDIDDAVKYSIGRRLGVTGPFMTADMGGLDVFDDISEYLFKDLSTNQESLANMRGNVAKGDYGQKTGKGFYNWSREESKEMNERREKELIYWMKKEH